MAFPNNIPTEPRSPEIEEAPDLIWEEDDMSQIEAQEMQGHMETLLGDLDVFKRKLATDHDRFRSTHQREPRRRRWALGDVTPNGP